jgi:hypothetical protein
VSKQKDPRSLVIQLFSQRASDKESGKLRKKQGLSGRCFLALSKQRRLLPLICVCLGLSGRFDLKEIIACFACLVVS